MCRRSTVKSSPARSRRRADIPRGNDSRDRAGVEQLPRRARTQPAGPPRCPGDGWPQYGPVGRPPPRWRRAIIGSWRRPDHDRAHAGCSRATACSVCRSARAISAPVCPRASRQGRGDAWSTSRTRQSSQRSPTWGCLAANTRSTRCSSAASAAPLATHRRPGRRRRPPPRGRHQRRLTSPARREIK